MTIGEDHSRVKRTQAETLEVEGATGLRVGRVQQLEPCIDLESVNDVSDHPATHSIRGFEYHDLVASSGHDLCTAKAGHAAPNDQDPACRGLGGHASNLEELREGRGVSAGTARGLVRGSEAERRGGLEWRQHRA
jgi:hypothetical protein